MAKTSSIADEKTYTELLELNSRYLWNPFTQMQEYLGEPPLVIERAEGPKLYDIEGREYWDGNSSLWVNVHGHGVPELDEAIVEQLGRVAHTTLLGQASVPALELAQRLVELTPPSLGKVFFCDSGANAVEIALKLAFAYWQRVGRPEKSRFLTMRNGYHGDTIGTMAVGGIDLFHAQFGALFFETEKVPYPYAYRGLDGDACLAELERALGRNEGEVAAVVVEPLVQAAGGMITMPPGYLTEVARLAREHEALLICDEVATGFGRTGALFACDHEDVAPDLMTIGKGLTGGYLPVAATLATDEIYSAFLGSHAELRTFFHGHSYTGNQLGCAVALASLDLFERDGLVEHVARAGDALGRLLEPIAELPHVGEVRRRGFLCGIELVADRITREPFDWRLATGRRVCLRARELGLVTRPLGDVVTFVPPLASTEGDLEAMTKILFAAVRDTTS